MGNEEIIKSGFIRGFISEYYEDKVYSYYPDKDRLLYALCNTEEEKRDTTFKEIEIAKSKIKALGYEYLSSAYLLSCKAENVHTYIEYDKRYSFWLNRFVEEFEEDFQTFRPIHDALLIFTNKKELEEACFENDYDFWEAFPKRLSPKIQDLPLVIAVETELEAEIRFAIEEREMTPEEIESQKIRIKDFRKRFSGEQFDGDFQFAELEDDFKKAWEIDFEEFEKYVGISKPLEELFNLSELLVQLERLDMLNSFLTPFSTQQLSMPNLKIDQVALMYVYEGNQITRNNSEEIVKKYGNNSGERLFQRFIYFSKTSHRVKRPSLCTPKKLENKIELLESVCGLLSEAAKKRAVEELNILKTIFKNEYE